MNANKEKQVSNLVTEFVKNIKNKYKYICDTFLEPAYDDYNKYTKDEINKKNISLKIIRDSIIYFIENYEDIPDLKPNDDTLNIAEVNITELDYVFSKSFRLLPCDVVRV